MIVELFRLDFCSKRVSQNEYSIIFATFQDK